LKKATIKDWYCRSDASGKKCGTVSSYISFSVLIYSAFDFAFMFKILNVFPDFTGAVGVNAKSVELCRKIIF
jgi:hypothetical protein